MLKIKQILKMFENSYRARTPVIFACFVMGIVRIPLISERQYRNKYQNVKEFIANTAYFIPPTLTSGVLSCYHNAHKSTSSDGVAAQIQDAWNETSVMYSSEWMKVLKKELRTLWKLTQVLPFLFWSIFIIPLIVIVVNIVIVMVFFTERKRIIKRGMSSGSIGNVIDVMNIAKKWP